MKSSHIVSFDENKVAFLHPHGRYAIELHGSFFMLRGQHCGFDNHSITYDNIDRMFFFPLPGANMRMALVIVLTKPIEEAQQHYPILVIQVTQDSCKITVNLEEDVLQKEYNGELWPAMQGCLANLLAKSLKVLSRKKVFILRSTFQNADGQCGIKCMVGGNAGVLYPLKKHFVFIHSPPICVRHDDIDAIDIHCINVEAPIGMECFDMCVKVKAGTNDGSSKCYVFSGIGGHHFTRLHYFLMRKKTLSINVFVDASSYIAEASDDAKNDEASSPMCTICWDRGASHALIPCGHRCVCRECWESLNSQGQGKCPICRQMFTDVLRIFSP